MKPRWRISRPSRETAERIASLLIREGEDGEAVETAISSEAAAVGS
jgi:hypothetical protein